MITILICPDIMDSEFYDALFDTMDSLTKNGDSVEFVFENPDVYRKAKLKSEYISLKKDLRFFKYPYKCRELTSGSIYQYIKSCLNGDNQRYNNHADIFLAGASEEILQLVINEYRDELRFSVKALLKSNNVWSWEEIYNTTQPDKIGNRKSEIELNPKPDEKIQLKDLISPEKKSKQKKIILLSVTAVLIILVILIFLLINPVSEKEEKEAVNNISEPASEAEEETTLSEQELAEKASDIFNRYFMEQISYDEAKELYEELPETDNDEIKKIISDTDVISESRLSYQAGKQELENRNYKEAIEHYKNVVEIDTNYYMLAQAESSLALSDYKTSEKQKAEEMAEAENYGEAYIKLQTIKEEFPDDSFLISECSNMQNKYMNEWINAQRQWGNYFGENGAVTLMYSYQYFDIDGGSDALIQEGYNYEREQLFNIINQKRAELGYEPLESNDKLLRIADGDALLVKEERNDEIIPSCNKNLFYASNALQVMENNYIQIEGAGEFLESSKSVGIGIIFDEESMTCIWAVLTASETEFLE